MWLQRRFYYNDLFSSCLQAFLFLINQGNQASLPKHLRVCLGKESMCKNVHQWLFPKFK